MHTTAAPRTHTLQLSTHMFITVPHVCVQVLSGLVAYAKDSGSLYKTAQTGLYKDAKVRSFACVECGHEKMS
jgi:hypothetical protein